MVVLLLPLAGCGNHDAGVPTGCREGESTVLGALARAPAPVRVDGAAISKCFARAASSADVQNIGSTYIDVAQRLADQARSAPHSAAALRLGYLIGAVRRGAGRDFGVYYETHRRLEAVLAGIDVNSPEFVRGERAGERSG